MRRRIGIIILIISLVWITYLGYVYNKSYFEHYPKVTVAMAERKPFIQDISTTGYIESNITSTIKSTVSGNVRAVNIKIGDYVDTNKILFLIDSPEINLQIEEARLNIERIGLDIEKAKKESIDTSQARIALERDEEAYKKAEEDLKRMESLFKVGAISEMNLKNYRDQVESARLTFEASKANYDLLKKQADTEMQLNKKTIDISLKSLKNTQEKLAFLKSQLEIKSKTKGRVVSVFVQKGESVSPGTPLATIADEDSISVSCLVDPKLITKVGIGQEIRFKIDPFSTKEYSARITSISEGFEQSNGSSGIRVVGKIDKYSPEIKIGIPVYARILIKERKLSTVVPISAIYQESPEDIENPLYYLNPPSPEETESYVFVVETTPSTPDDRELARLIRDNVKVVRKRKVKIGGIKEDEAEILSGVNQFERVVTYSSRPLNDYDRVIVIERGKWLETQ
ncbi:MAG: efflux RND transporter periplasmic adaptor subunit [bacterium]